MCSRPRKPIRKPKPERPRGLRLVGQRGVIELQLVQRLAQLGVVGPVDRVEAGEDHRVRVPVAAEAGLGRPGQRGHRVADPGLADLLDPADQVAHLADAERVGLDRIRGDHPDLQRLVRGLGRHHQHPFAVRDLAVEDPDVGDHAAVGVVDRVEDQRPGRRVRVPHRGRGLLDDLVEQFAYALAGLGRHPEDLVRVAADDRRPARRRTCPAGHWAGRSCSGSGSRAGRRRGRDRGWPGSGPRSPAPRRPAAPLLHRPRGTGRPRR